MSHLKETLQGCTIEIKDETDLTINGKHIDYEKDNTGNNWSSRYLPYTNYDSLLDLARAIVKDTAEFSVKD